MTEFPGDLRDPAASAQEPEQGNAPVTIVVCNACRFDGDAEADPRRGTLFARATVAAARSPNVSVRQVTCLGNCNRSLSAALVRDGSWHYVFGGLDIENAADLVAGAELYSTSAVGRLPWSGRPEALKGALVARIPPLEFTKDIS